MLRQQAVRLSVYMNSTALNNCSLGTEVAVL